MYFLLSYVCIKKEKISSASLYQFVFSHVLFRLWGVSSAYVTSSLLFPSSFSLHINPIPFSLLLLSFQALLPVPSISLPQCCLPLRPENHCPCHCPAIGVIIQRHPNKKLRLLPARGGKQCGHIKFENMSLTCAVVRTMNFTHGFRNMCV